MKLFVVLALFVASAICSPTVEHHVSTYGVQETIEKAAKAVADAVENAINTVDKKADDIIDTIESAAKSGGGTANSAVDKAFDVLKNLIIKAEEALLPTDGCMKGKIEQISEKKSTFGTELLQCVIDGTAGVREVKTSGLDNIRQINTNFKEVLKETCDGWWDCGKLIAKFTAEEAIAVGKCYGMIVTLGAKMAAVATKAVACVGGVAASYTGQALGIIKDCGKCITDLFTKSNKQYLLN